MPQIVRRSPNGVSDFEAGPTLRTTDKRHTTVFLRDDTLTVFYSNAGDCREWIMRADVSLEPDWHRWQAGSPTTLLAPETEYEGAACPLEPSRRGSVQHPIHRPRDPCIFEEKGRTYLLYTVAGERGIAIGELRN